MKVNLVALLIIGAAGLAVYLGVTGRYKTFGQALRSLPLTPAQLSGESTIPSRPADSSGSTGGGGSSTVR